MTAASFILTSNADVMSLQISFGSWTRIWTEVEFVGGESAVGKAIAAAGGIKSGKKTYKKAETFLPQYLYGIMVRTRKLFYI